MEDHFEDDRKSKSADEIIISYYLNMFINKRKFWHIGHFCLDEDARVYNVNPWHFFQTLNPNYLFVKRRTEACGKTDGCEAGCWRIMARDKLIKTDETGRILGFKKILKFCEKERKRSEEEEENRQGIWVMEEYRLVDKWKQDQVICKIRILLQPEVSSLLANHFSSLPKRIIPCYRNSFLPRWDVCVPDVTEDEVISYYLKMLVDNRNDWLSHFIRDEDARVYNLNPWHLLQTHKYNGNYLLFVKHRTEACGKTDGCEAGCWRVMARDKLIKTEKTGRILGFKKILKFCDKERERSKEEEDQRIWVMEEYRLVDKWKQDQVICKIRLLQQPAVSSLLAKHFSFLPKRIIPCSPKSFLPRWDPWELDALEDEIVSYYLKMLLDNQNDWPSHFLQSEQVYGVVPWMIVDANQSSVELELGSYFFVNRTESSGRTDGCDGGCWRIIRRDKVITSKRNQRVLGFKRMFKFCEKVPQPVYKFWADENFKENEFKMTWIMDEYRLAKKKDQGKAICRITLLFPIPLDCHIRYY